MKTISALLIFALLVVSGVLVYLVKNGIALRPAGVIRPSEIGTTPDLIGRSVGGRLFPDFHAAKNVIWILSESDETLSRIPFDALANFQSPQKPTLQDLSKNPTACTENCWYIQKNGVDLPESLQQKLTTPTTLVIYVQDFNRDEKVPEVCENEKILQPQCVRPVSIREVRRKLKTPAPHFFMRRYLDNQFFLFIEKSAARR